MLDFAIFAVCFVIFLLVLVFYLYPGSSKQTTIPGLDPSDPKEGNAGDIVLAGGLQEFLMSLHKTHGPIASFWMGTKLVVSLGSVDLFKAQAQIFDKPADLLELYRGLAGTSSILFANGVEARKRRQNIDKLLIENLNTLFPQILQLCKEVVDRWEQLPSDQHVPTYQYMYALCMKTCTRMLFGHYFFDDKNVLEFSRAFEPCMTELEEMSNGTLADAESPRRKTFDEAAKKMRTILAKSLREHKSRKASTGSTPLLVDVLSGSGMSDDQAIDDCVTFVIKYYTLIQAMTWSIYFLATHPDLQDRIAKEADELMSTETELTPEQFLKVRSVQTAIKETLRTSIVEPWTARFQDIDVEIGGHIIPKKTPVIQALGVIMHSEQYWKLPQRFDASRFEDGKGAPAETFCPFGFAGKRQCPGRDLAMLQMSVFIVTLCRRLKLQLVENQVVTPTYTVVTKPEDEVWLLLSKRR
uniref:Putative cytochrome p450 cyp4/cyp19/cyp26 subfamily protein n=1 Tax=Ornithodoros turicata TaxID=34597 RepID=A0A2R5LAE0_9ACAR